MLTSSSIAFLHYTPSSNTPLPTSRNNHRHIHPPGPPPNLRVPPRAHEPRLIPGPLDRRTDRPTRDTGHRRANTKQQSPYLPRRDRAVLQPYLPPQRRRALRLANPSGETQDQHPPRAGKLGGHTHEACGWGRVVGDPGDRYVVLVLSSLLPRCLSHHRTCLTAHQFPGSGPFACFQCRLLDVFPSSLDMSCESSKISNLRNASTASETNADTGPHNRRWRSHGPRPKRHRALSMLSRRRR